jgi:hypothetical protein
MYVYIQSEVAGRAGATNDLWTVGHYDPEGKWHSDSDHSSREAAATRVSYLNGIQGAPNFTPRVLAKVNDEVRPYEIRRHDTDMKFAVFLHDVRTTGWYNRGKAIRLARNAKAKTTGAIDATT